jgi:GxxExxY protein
LFTDLIVNSAVILENKVVSSITDVHIAQLLSYLAVTRLQIGLILNFAKPSLEVRRIVRSQS